jgi:hypothetical protein
MENPTWSIPVKVDETFHHLSLVKGTPPGDSARTFCGRTAMNADNCATLVEAAERFAREQHKKNTAAALEVAGALRKAKAAAGGKIDFLPDPSVESPEERVGREEGEARRSGRDEL